MGYLNKICKFISRLCTIWKLNQHTTKGKNPLSTFPKDIVHYCYYDIHIFHHSNFTISNSGSIKFRTFPLYSTLWLNLIKLGNHVSTIKQSQNTIRANLWHCWKIWSHSIEPELLNIRIHKVLPWMYNHNNEIKHSTLKYSI